MSATYAKLEARRAVLAGFKSFCDEHHRPPSIRELGEFLGYPDPKACQGVIRRLIRDGMIVCRERVLRRAERVSAKGLRWLAGEEE